MAWVAPPRQAPRSDLAIHYGAYSLSQHWQQLAGKPWVVLQPWIVPGAGVGQGDHGRQPVPPAPDSGRDATCPGPWQMPALGILAQQQGQFDVGQGLQNLMAPVRCALAQGGQITTAAGAGVTKAHGYQGD